MKILHPAPTSRFFSSLWLVLLLSKALTLTVFMTRLRVLPALLHLNFALLGTKI